MRRLSPILAAGLNLRRSDARPVNSLCLFRKEDICKIGSSQPRVAWTHTSSSDSTDSRMS